MFNRMRSLTVRRHAAAAGIIIAFVAVSLIVMLGMLALALDVGYMINTKNQLQTAADAAALAAAMELGQADPDTSARTTAKAYLNLHRAGDQYADVDANTTAVEIGMATRNTTNQTFSFTAMPANTPGRDSVKVVVKRGDGSTGPVRGPLPLFFGGILGLKSANMTASAVATLTARDVSVCYDVSGSMNSDSTMMTLDKHVTASGSLVGGVTTNTEDLYLAMSGAPSQRHIQRRMEATGRMYDDSPMSSSGYSIYMPPQDGRASAAYAGLSGATWGLIGTDLLPFGSGTIAEQWNPQTDPGLVFIPMGRFSFRAKSPDVAAGDQMNSNTINTGLHSTTGNDTTTADGNLWGIVVANNVNPAWAGIEDDLRTRRQYSEEELYCLRNPQDPNVTTLSPRNPQYTAVDGTNVAAVSTGTASTFQESNNQTRWRLRAMVILDLAEWRSNLLNPLWVLPNHVRPVTSGSAFSALLSTATGGTFGSDAVWLQEARDGNFAIRISRAAGGITTTMDLPQGKRYLTGNQPEWAFYEYSGTDGYRQGRHDWSNCITLYVNGSPTAGTFTMTVTRSGNQTTASLARNATAAQVQTALGNLSNVGTGNVICTGGPLPATPIGIHFKVSGVTAMTVANSGFTSGTSAAVSFNQSFDDNTGASTFQFKTTGTTGYSGTDSPSFPALATNAWRGSDGIPYTADDVVYGLAYYDVNGNSVRDAWERTAKAWSLARLASSSIPAAPNASGAQWRWATQPQLFSAHPLYRYHYWENQTGASIANTAAGDCKWWDANEVRSTVTVTSGTGTTTTNWAYNGTADLSATGSSTDAKMAEKMFLWDMPSIAGQAGDSGRTTVLGDYLRFVSNPYTDIGTSTSSGSSYPGRPRLMQWRFGIKTVVEAQVQARAPTINGTQTMYPLPAMPHQAGRDAVFAFAQYLYSQSENQDYYAKDYTALAVFGTNAGSNSLVVPLTEEYDRLWSLDHLTPNSFATQQAGQNSGNTNIIPIMAIQFNHWTGNTSIGAGLRRAFGEIDKQRSAITRRQNSKPTILLITDGRPHVAYDRAGNIDVSNVTSSTAYGTTNEETGNWRMALGTSSNPPAAGFVEQYDGPEWDVDADGNLLQTPKPSSSPNWDTYDGWYTSAMQSNPFGVAVSRTGTYNNAADLLARQEVWFLKTKRNTTFHVVLLGNDGDPFLGNWIAYNSNGICIWAKGTPDQYVPKLQAAFRTLAAFRPVSLTQ